MDVKTEQGKNVFAVFSKPKPCRCKAIMREKSRRLCTLSAAVSPTRLCNAKKSNYCGMLTVTWPI